MPAPFYDTIHFSRQPGNPVVTENLTIWANKSNLNYLNMLSRTRPVSDWCVTSLSAFITKATAPPKLLSLPGCQVPVAAGLLSAAPSLPGPGPTVLTLADGPSWGQLTLAPNRLR